MEAQHPQPSALDAARVGLLGLWGLEAMLPHGQTVSSPEEQEMTRPGLTAAAKPERDLWSWELSSRTLEHLVGGGRWGGLSRAPTSRGLESAPVVGL